MNTITRLAALFLLLAPAAGAVETAAFLNVGAGARALALGSAYTALGEDADSLYWNPAGIAGLEKRQVTLSHAELTQKTRQNFFGYAQPTSNGAFGASLSYLSHSKIDGRDAAGRPTGGFEASDAVVGMSYGRKTELAELGATVKYIRTHIGSAEAQTVALDAGARKPLGSFILGAAIRNLGPGLKFDSQRNDLPLRLALGAAYKLAGGHAASAELANGPRGAGSDAGIGGEFQAVKDFFLRGGYTTLSRVPGGSNFDAARGLTLGVGFNNRRWSLDYAAVTMGELGSAHRFTFGARF
ncbi:MAG: PorV/PorQ family protein [Elusimicrobiota bacterium]